MQTDIAFPTRLGLLTFLLAALLAGVHIVLRGPFVDPTADPAGFVQMVTGANFTLAWLVMAAGFTLDIFGVLAACRKRGGLGQIYVMNMLVFR